MTVSELEHALVALGRELEVPESPDVAPAVLDRIERPDAEARGRRPRRWSLVVAFAALAAVAATLAVPDARSALFRFLHIGGERIEFVDELPSLSPDPAGVDLDVVLGERVSLADARRRAGFDLRELEDAPDRVYLGPRGTVWFLYGEPQAVKLLVAQTALLSVDDQLILKKISGPGTRVEESLVNGQRGYFLSGDPHLVLLLDEVGQPVEESAWLAQNVLVWEEDGIAIRLEGDFSKGEAVDLAKRLR